MCHRSRYLYEPRNAAVIPRQNFFRLYFVCLLWPVYPNPTQGWWHPTRPNGHRLHCYLWTHPQHPPAITSLRRAYVRQFQLAERYYLSNSATSGDQDAKGKVSTVFLAANIHRTSNLQMWHRAVSIQLNWSDLGRTIFFKVDMEQHGYPFVVLQVCAMISRRKLLFSDLLIVSSIMYYCWYWHHVGTSVFIWLHHASSSSIWIFKVCISTMTWGLSAARFTQDLP